MAGSHNTIIIIGNLGREPELRQTATGDPVADFSVATSERRRGQDGQQTEQTTWFRISAFGRLAEVARDYLRKGSYVYVEGPLTAREYTTRDGRTGTALEVRAREIRMLDKREAGEGGYQDQDQGQGSHGGQAAPRRQEAQAADDLGDDIPF